MTIHCQIGNLKNSYVYGMNTDMILKYAKMIYEARTVLELEGGQRLICMDKQMEGGFSLFCRCALA